MNLKKLLARLVLAGVIGGLSACGGSSSSTPAEEAPPQVSTGIFVDSAVANIGYRTATQEGVTNADGEYDYVEGEKVVFFIGDLEFPPVTAKGVVTPMDIAEADDVNDPMVVNIARLLQSLDADGDPSNGITIPAGAAAIATPVDFTLSVAEFAASTAVTTLVANSGSTNITLVSAEDAVAHLNQTVADVLAPQLVGTWHLSFGSGAGGVVLSFLPTGDYLMGEAVPVAQDDDSGFSGIERGTYTWNPVTGALTVELETDTNGDWGLSHPNGAMRMLVNGNTLTFIEEGGNEQPTFTRVSQQTGTIVGSWAQTIDTENYLGVITFLANGTYFIVEDGEPEGEGGPGVEHGTYTWNGATGALKALTIIRDTNGDWGLSDIVGTDEALTFTVEGRKLILFEDDMEFEWGEVCATCAVPNSDI